MTTPAPLHPIVKALIHDNLPLPPAELGTLPKTEACFHQLFEELYRNASEPDTLARCPDMFETARATKDSQLELAALIGWSLVSGMHNRPEENQALVNRITSMIDGTVPEELRHFFLYAQYLNAYRLGNPHAVRLLRRLLKICPPESTTWQNAAFSFLITLAEQGCLRDRQELQIRFESCHNQKSFPAYAMVPFINAVQVGAINTAIPMLQNIRALYEHGGLLSAYGVHRVQLELMMRHLPGVWVEPDTSYAQEEASLREAGIRLDSFMMTTRHLLEGRVEDALASARSYATNLGAPFFALQRFDGYDMVRAELASGHVDGATAVLRKRFEYGAYNWIDNFFLARIAYRKGKPHIAEAAYQRTLNMARYYGAENRLLFECCLASELPAATLARWTAMALRNPPDQKPFTVNTPSIPHAPSLKNGRMDRPGAAEFVGTSRLASTIRERIREYAKLDPPVLLVGETGTGKELVARQLHETGPRKAYPFTAVNCAGISPSLLQSELFGHVRGAFTGATRARAGLFETAANGTLLLDEIGDMPLEMQAVLLRVLETREYCALGSDTPRRVRCRIVTATNRDLLWQIREGTFRQDLFFRISGLTLRLPPLRDRVEDIEALAMHFFRMFHPHPSRCGMSADLLEALKGHAWPGNVRELRGIVENLCLLFADEELYTYAMLVATAPSWRKLEASPGEGGEEEEPAIRVDGEEEDMQEDDVPPAGRPFGSGIGVEGGGLLSGNVPAAGSADGSETGYRVPPRPGDGLTHLEKLAACFAHHKRLRRKEIIVMLGISQGTATTLLHKLIGQGVVRKVEPTRSPRTHYFEYAGGAGSHQP